MTARRFFVVSGSLLAIVAQLTAAPAAAKTTPEQKCTDAKLKAAAKKGAAKLLCHAKAAAKSVSVDINCLGKAEAAFASAFTRAESKGGCVTTGDASAVETSVNDFVGSVVSALPGGATKADGKCAGAKRKAAGKHAAAELSCNAKAVKKNVPVDGQCLEKAETALRNAFARAENKGGCATVGDVGDIDEMVDDFVNRVVSQLTPGAATTTTTTAVGSTTTSSTVPSNTVIVGQGGSLTFVPNTLTIRAGQTVHWVWASNFHNVVSGTVTGGNEMPDGKFCSPNDTNCSNPPLSNTGATYDHTFTEVGSYPYFCVPHGTVGMVGTIEVQP